MKISFIAHYYHGEKTKSHEFFVREVLFDFEVTVYFDEEYRENQVINAPRLDLERVTDADRIVIWQSERMLLRILAFGFDPAKIIFIPMHDSAVHWDESFIQKLTQIRTICFSKSLHTNVCREVKNRVYAMYMPEPVRNSKRADPDGEFAVYCWVRRPESLVHLKRFLDSCPPLIKLRITLKFDIDPGVEIRSEDLGFLSRHRIAEDLWHPTKHDYLKYLASHDLFIAPRMVEGIGLSFLDAMAANVVCVGPDSPTFTDYIQKNFTGFVLGRNEDLVTNRPALGAIAQIRDNTARMVETKRREWVSSHVQRLRAFVSSESGAKQVPVSAIPVMQRDERYVSNDSDVMLSIVMATYNCKGDLKHTLETLLAADLASIEIVFSDGGSTDGTLDVTSTWSGSRKVVRSGVDNGPYDAMERGVELATGRYIWFLNAGDLLPEPDVIAATIHTLSSESADLFYFDYVYRDLSGIDHYKSPAPFEETFRQLESGDIDYAWRDNIPCHQGTIIRRNTFLRFRFDKYFQIAADHEQYFRMWQAGVRFRKIPITLAIYVGGGMSSQHELRCVDEWWKIADRYSGYSESVQTFYLKDTINVLQRLDPEKLSDAVFQQVAACMDGGWYNDRTPRTGGKLQSAVQHYLHFGWRSGIEPSPFFSTNEYRNELLKSNHFDDSTLKDVNLFLHWVLYGHRAYFASHLHYIYSRAIGRITQRMSTYKDLIRSSSTGIDAAVTAEDHPQLELPTQYEAQSILSSILAMKGRQFVTAAYRYILGRMPDDEGMSSHVDALESGQQKIEVLRSIVTSPEAIARGEKIAALKAAIEAPISTTPNNGEAIDTLMALDGTAFIEAAYLQILGRHVDNFGRSNYLAELAGGTEKLDIICALYSSPESRARGRTLSEIDHIVARRITSRSAKLASLVTRLLRSN